MWKAARHLSDSADRATRAADRLEEVQQRLAHMFEDGYGGNALRLIELMEQQPVTTVPDEILTVLREIRRMVWGTNRHARAAEHQSAAEGKKVTAAIHNEIANRALKHIQALNYFFPEIGDTAERDYEKVNQCGDRSAT